ncbi:MAG: 2-dehydro-3-deoxyglucokinase [Pseudomonadota bacterium]
MVKLGHRLVAFGEGMVELRRVNGAQMMQSFGGDTLNMAIYLARLAGPDLTVDFATALGDTDSFSADMIQFWENEGVYSHFLSRISGRLPGLYTITVDARSERSFSYWRDASAARFYFDTDITPLAAQMDGFDVLYLSGISLAILPPESRLKLFELMRVMRTHGKIIVFDNNYRPRLWASRDVAAAVYTMAYQLADIALVTLDDEIARHDGQSEDAMLATILSYPSPELVIKRGARPTLLRDMAGRVEEIATLPVEQVVDTTAAGDSFAAAYLAVRMRGGAPSDAAKAGNRLAAAVIQHSGAIIPRGAMPSFISERMQSFTVNQSD